MDKRVEVLIALVNQLKQMLAHPWFPEAVDVIGDLFHRIVVAVTLEEIGNGPARVLPKTGYRTNDPTAERSRECVGIRAPFCFSCALSALAETRTEINGNAEWRRVELLAVDRQRVCLAEGVPGPRSTFPCHPARLRSLSLRGSFHDREPHSERRARARAPPQPPVTALLGPASETVQRKSHRSLSRIARIPGSGR